MPPDPHINIEKALADIRAGRQVIVVDDEKRENEGDLTMAADLATPEAVNFMAGHPLPDYKALIAKYGDRFQAQDMNLIQPVPAGLLGPIQLIATAP